MCENHCFYDVFNVTGGHIENLMKTMVFDVPAGIRMRNAGPGWAGHRRIAGMLSL